MTENDRAVQVPMSLIERMKRHMEREQLELLDEAVEEVVALLSQPTPTAEPACGVPSPHDAHRVDPAPGDDFFDCAGTTTYWHDPEPPRIEDLAPGTLLELGKRWTVARDHDGVTFLYAENDGYSTLMPASAVDPSTIRDVTPPGADQ